MKYKKSTFEIKVSRINETPGSLKLDRPRSAYEYWNEKITAAPWYDPEKEMMVSLLLDTRHKTIAHSLVSIGSLNETTAHPREIFRPAIASGCYALVMIHNHPSGDPSPSEADRRLTRRIAEAGTLLNMPLVDHVIVGREDAGESSPYFSFREAGLL